MDTRVSAFAASKAMRSSRYHPTSIQRFWRNHRTHLFDDISCRTVSPREDTLIQRIFPWSKSTEPSVCRDLSVCSPLHVRCVDRHDCWVALPASVAHQIVSAHDSEPFPFVLNLCSVGLVKRIGLVCWTGDIIHTHDTLELSTSLAAVLELEDDQAITIQARHPLVQKQHF